MFLLYPIIIPCCMSVPCHASAGSHLLPAHHNGGASSLHHACMFGYGNKGIIYILCFIICGGKTDLVHRKHTAFISYITVGAPCWPWAFMFQLPRQHLTGAAVTAARYVRSLVILSCHQPDWAEVIWSRAGCHLGGWLVASYQVIRRKCPDSAAGWFIIKADVAADSKGRREREGRARPFALTPLTDQRTVFAVQ